MRKGESVGGRPHMPVDRAAPVQAFEAIAADFPIFRLEPIDPHR